MDRKACLLLLTLFPFLTGAEWNAEFNGFTVYGEPDREVFWEVLAERDDPVIRQVGLPVEEDKGPDNKLCRRGKLLHPAAYGYPETMGQDYELLQGFTDQGHLKPRETGHLGRRAEAV